MEAFPKAKINADVLRTKFSLALSDMYQKEVPLYGDLIHLVHEVDDDVVYTQKRPALEPRHRIERHGAIRLGTPHELRTIGRLFALFGMHPVGYYDLSVVNFPLHATAFRPITTSSLDKNPFRVFTTLLRTDLLSESICTLAQELLAKRSLFSDRLMQLIGHAEVTDCLSNLETDELLAEALKIFKWHSVATVSYDDYKRLLDEHPMVADIASFSSAHINHLTPRTLDIDRVQRIMEARGLPAKDRIEGPPPRTCEILLRQTSFKALKEDVKFHGDDGQLVIGSHTARFGEVEQRGAALTRKGRDLYDQLLARARAEEAQRPIEDRDIILKKVFRDYPDSWGELRKQKLSFNYYKLTADGWKHAQQIEHEQGVAGNTDEVDLSQLLENGQVLFVPITYEDFLPVSAAGIFTSNLRTTTPGGMMRPGNADKAGFEQSLGQNIVDEILLYEDIQNRSIEECRKALKIKAILVD